MSKAVVYKYGLIFGRNKILAPAGAQFFSVGVQNLQVVAWALCDPDAARQWQTLLVVFTGEERQQSCDLIPIGTVTIEGLVYHVFEEAQSER
jgi:hypothetical protein